MSLRATTALLPTCLADRIGRKHRQQEWTGTNPARDPLRSSTPQSATLRGLGRLETLGRGCSVGQSRHARIALLGAGAALASSAAM
jgi:hypothetical protein